MRARDYARGLESLHRKATAAGLRAERGQPPTEHGQLWTVLADSSVGRVLGYVQGYVRPDDALERFRAVVAVPAGRMLVAVRTELTQDDVANRGVDAVGWDVWAYQGERLADKLEHRAIGQREHEHETPRRRKGNG